MQFILSLGIASFKEKQESLGIASFKEIQDRVEEEGGRRPPEEGGGDPGYGEQVRINLPQIWKKNLAINMQLNSIFNVSCISLNYFDLATKIFEL